MTLNFKIVYVELLCSGLCFLLYIRCSILLFIYLASSLRVFGWVLCGDYGPFWDFFSYKSRSRGYKTFFLFFHAHLS